MPYFKNNKINLLFIHIPKTGGSSLEIYFSKKYNITLDSNSLHGEFSLNLKNKIDVIATPQHILFKTMMKYKNEFNIDTNNLKIITIVRNPYYRLVSDLFHFKLININSNKKYVYDVILQYLGRYVYDNHSIPQYLFLFDENNEIRKDITIFHTETLKNDMIDYGFKDFNLNENKNKNKNKNKNIDYMNYLNDNSIALINKHYYNDFKYFNYEMLPCNN